MKIWKSKSEEILQILRQFESRNIIFIAKDGSFPVVWDSAAGMYVRDVDGRKYLDLTAAFGVAVAGHCNKRVVLAGAKQMKRLAHAMGDVHPHPLKAYLARELSKITFERWKNGVSAKTIFCNSGFEAVEAGLKTAILATGRRDVIAFKGAYHGLGYGALNTTHRKYFREPFESQLGKFGHFLTFPVDSFRMTAFKRELRDLKKKIKPGAVIVEPVQGRGGINIPVGEFFSVLREFCNETGAVLIVDEIYTGFGRTGKWFGIEHFGVVPDIICLGKGLTGGFPLSACVGRADLMDCWEESKGEALHTSTFLGNPVGCAMALANIKEIQIRKLVENSHKEGMYLLSSLKELTNAYKGLNLSARGLGLMVGFEIKYADGKPAGDLAFKIVTEMLARGFIILPEGEFGNVISFTPPLIITRKQIDTTINALADTLSVLTKAL